MRQAAEGGAPGRGHAPAEAVDCAVQRKVWLSHDIDGGALPGLDSGKIVLAEIADRIPMLGVDDGEEGMAGICELPGGDLERSDPAVGWRTHGRFVEVALGKRQCRSRPVQLRLSGLRAGDGLARLYGKLPRSFERNSRGFLGGARLINGAKRSKVLAASSS